MTDDPLTPADALAGRDRLRQLADGAKVLGLLQTAADAGLVAALHTPRSFEELTTVAPAVDPVRLRRLLHALRNAGILVEDGGRYALARDVLALATDVVGIDLDAVLAEALLGVRRAASALATAQYPSGQDALVLAEVSGGRPVPVMIGLLTGVYDAVPQFRDRLAEGGPFLDAGAGIGGNLLAAATAFPALRAVGVEADATVAAELQARVDAAALGDRVTVRQGDVRTLDLEPAGFAVAYWAQTYFPLSTREASLGAVVRALRPDGVLLVQELFPAPSDDDLGALVDQVIMTSSGVAYGESAEQLSAELQAAGLTCDEPVTTALGRLVVARKL